MYHVSISNIIDTLKREGPLIGRELENRLGVSYEQKDTITYLWALCTVSEQIHLQSVSQRYLRIDRNNGSLNLSPSIPNEFSYFSVVGLEQLEVEKKARLLREHHQSVSDDKRSVVKSLIRAISQDSNLPQVNKYFCFLLGGDVAYNMASDFPREATNGELVHGSDIDIVILHHEGADSGIVRTLDDAVAQQKIRLGRQPYKEEIDYIIKGMDLVKKQSEMGSPSDAVACKIIAESEFLYGDSQMHTQALDFLQNSGAAEKLKELRKIASFRRDDYERSLINRFRNELNQCT